MGNCVTRKAAQKRSQFRSRFRVLRSRIDAARRRRPVKSFRGFTRGAFAFLFRLFSVLPFSHSAASDDAVYSLATAPPKRPRAGISRYYYNYYCVCVFQSPTGKASNAFTRDLTPAPSKVGVISHRYNAIISGRARNGCRALCTLRIGELKVSRVRNDGETGSKSKGT